MQIAIEEPAPIAGIVFTVTVTVAEFLQPDAFVPVTEYVVLADGLAVILAPVVEESPAAGVQEYEVPPVAVRVVEEPLHMATPALAPMVGSAFTVTVTVAVLLQPDAFVPVTV